MSVSLLLTPHSPEHVLGLWRGFIDFGLFKSSDDPGLAEANLEDIPEVRAIQREELWWSGKNMEPDFRCWLWRGFLAAMCTFLSFSLLSVNGDKIPAEGYFDIYIQFYLWKSLKHKRYFIVFLVFKSPVEYSSHPHTHPGGFSWRLVSADL